MRIIVATTFAHAALYGLMSLTGLFQPSAGRLTPTEMSEWRARVCSTANALILIVGAVLCFSEWPYSPAKEGWISDHTWSHPVTFASIFVGYLQWDLCWVIFHQVRPRPASARGRAVLFCLALACHAAFALRSYSHESALAMLPPTAAIPPGLVAGRRLGLPPLALHRHHALRALGLVL